MNEQWQELKESIIELSDNDGTLTQQEACEFLANLMDVLETQMSCSENLNKWISVSERLPEREGWYLISLGDKTYGGADVDMYCDGWVKYGTHVLAWMPLPEPYRESEE